MEGDHLDVRDVPRDRRGRLWIATSGGVFRREGESFVRFPIPASATEHSYQFSPSMVYCIFEDRGGDLRFGAAGPVRGAYRFDGEDFRYFSEVDGLGDGHVASIGEDRGGNVWLGTTAGVYRFDGERFVHFTKQR